MSCTRSTSKLRWGFSVSMLLAYLAVFHVWTAFPEWGTAALGVFVAIGMAVGVVAWNRRSYFVNRLDCFTHLAVAVDVLLEGLLFPSHTGYGFYECAVGFSVVIGAYRYYAWRSGGAAVGGAASPIKTTANPTQVPSLANS